MESPCLNCQSQKTIFACGLCEGALCKNCTEFVEPGSFSFLQALPKELSHRHYCFSCFGGTVQPALQRYHRTMFLARQVLVIDKPRRMPLPLLKSSKQRLSVQKCADKEEALMRLAFQAADLGFNAIIKVDMKYEKVRMDGYQTTRWHATGYPADLDPVRLERQNV